MAKLRTYVSVDGVTYGPDSDVPAEVAARISNEKVWDGKPPANAGTAVPDLSGRTAKAITAPTASVTPAVTDVPPKAGKGSGAEAWAAYAASHGVTVEDGASRDDVIAALDVAGVPTE